MLLGASSKLRCCGFFSSLSTHSLFREHTEKQVTLAYKAGCLLPLGRFYCAHWLTLRMFLAHTLGFCYSTNRTLISSCAVLLVRWLFSFRFSLRLLLPKKKWIKKTTQMYNNRTHWHAGRPTSAGSWKVFRKGRRRDDDNVCGLLKLVDCGYVCWRTHSVCVGVGFLKMFCLLIWVGKLFLYFYCWTG